MMMELLLFYLSVTMNAAAPGGTLPSEGSATKNTIKNSLSRRALGEALRRVPSYIVNDFHGLGANTMFMPVSPEPRFTLFWLTVILPGQYKTGYTGKYFKSY